MIVGLVNDTTIKTNLIKAGVMTLLYPLIKHDRQFSKYKPSLRSDSLSFNHNNGLVKRVAQLEARQTLLEADSVLLRGQLELERVGA